MLNRNTNRWITIDSFIQQYDWTCNLCIFFIGPWPRNLFKALFVAIAKSIIIRRRSSFILITDSLITQLLAISRRRRSSLTENRNNCQRFFSYAVLLLSNCLASKKLYLSTARGKFQYSRN